jgi:hypothetical protein
MQTSVAGDLYRIAGEVNWIWHIRIDVDRVRDKAMKNREATDVSKDQLGNPKRKV